MQLYGEDCQTKKENEQFRRIESAEKKKMDTEEKGAKEKPEVIQEKKDAIKKGEDGY